jgi:hypothetical protein
MAENADLRTPPICHLAFSALCRLIFNFAYNGVAATRLYAAFSFSGFQLFPILASAGFSPAHSPEGFY